MNKKINIPISSEYVNSKCIRNISELNLSISKWKQKKNEEEEEESKISIVTDPFP